MKAFAVLALAFLSFGASAAIESTELTCQEIRTAIRRAGSQIVQTEGQPAGNKAAYATIYSDFTGTISCSGDSNPATAWVRSSNGKLCPAGQVCVRDGFFGLPTNLNYRDWL